jgi:catechol 2,3-dioxygenase-like lactoylglutathione lyase family enzyme
MFRVAWTNRRRDRSLGTAGIEVETGPVTRLGVRGEGISVYFRDPDGSLLEFISYDSRG